MLMCNLSIIDQLFLDENRHSIARMLMLRLKLYYTWEPQHQIAAPYKGRFI